MRVQRREKILKFLTSLWLVAASVAVYAQEAGTVIDKIIVKVDNYVVLKSDLENAYLN
jgi:peptidyl-prolyl cis-trans isomerase SurA